MVYHKAPYSARRNTPCTLSFYEPLSVGMDFLTIFMQMKHSYTSHSTRRKTLWKHNPYHSLRTVLLTLRDGCVQTCSSDKTEVILFTSKHNAIHMENVTVCFGDINITSENTVRNLRVIFDSALNMETVE